MEKVQRQPSVNLLLWVEMSRVLWEHVIAYVQGRSTGEGEGAAEKVTNLHWIYLNKLIWKWI